MFFLLVSALLILSVSIIWAYYKLSCGICKCSKHLVGKVVIITGGNAGIGYETAKDLADRGARVIIASRNTNRGNIAVEEIIEETGNIDVHFRKLDLASFDSVKEFAANILASEKRLDILINNAGFLEGCDEVAEDGMLAGMKINHFGPFLLTNLLLPLIKASTPSRIINVTSTAHFFGKIDLENLNSVKAINQSLASALVYSNTKLCNVLTTVELAKRLKGTGVTVNCLHPGLIITNILTDVKVLWINFASLIAYPFTKTVWEGAQTHIYLAVSPEVANVSGEYFSDCHLDKPSKIAKNVELARKLWDVSEKIVGLSKNVSVNNNQEKGNHENNSNGYKLK